MVHPNQPHDGSEDRYTRLVAEFAPSERVLSAILRRRAQQYGDQPLVRCGDMCWSYAETAAVAQNWANRLAMAGIEQGDRVAIHCFNRIEFLQIFLGCAWLGAAAVPFNTAFRGAQLSHVLENSSPKLLVVDEACASAYRNLPDGIALPAQIWTLRENGIFDNDGTAIEAPAAHAASLTAPGDTVAILYTSGTTGPSKGVCCPQAQMFWWGVYSARAVGIAEGDVLMTALPVFHTNALNTFYQAVLNGCQFVLLPKFSASGFWQSARDCGATVTYLLGAMAGILLSRPVLDDDRAHGIRVALGGAVPAQMHAPFLERFGVPLVDGYASTETNFAFFSAAPSEQPGTMGKLRQAAEVVVVDEYDCPVPDGEAGELLLRPVEPHSFATGYFRMPEKTVEAWQNLWFHTGDRVLREANGNYRFIDRMKDSIRRRGENISSWEVEQAIQSHPAVESCAAYPIPSELGEDEVAAAVSVKAGHHVEPLDIIRHVEGQLAYFAVPRYLRFVDSMPLTENGKIKKVVLREDALIEGIWDREKSGYQLNR